MKYNFICGVVLLASSSLSFADDGYQLTPIPLPPGTLWAANPGEDGFNSGPVLNQSHQVALTYLTSSLTWQPYVWNNGAFTALPLSQGFTSGGVTAINDAGTIVGYQQDANETTSNPVVWSGATATVLDQQGQSYGAALTISNSGQIGGLVSNSFIIYINTRTSAVLWNGTTATNLGNYGGLQASVIAINNNGQALITVRTPITDSHALLRSSDGTITDTIPTGITTSATGINSRGQVVGSTGPQNGDDWYPFLWDAGKFTQLAPSASDPSGVNFDPSAINDNDFIAGSAGDIVGPRYAALWMDGQLYDLNTLIAPNPDWDLIEATDIADDGTIVGIGQDDGNWQAFMLTPTTGGSFDISGVPEPASLALLALGSAVLFRRRK